MFDDVHLPQLATLSVFQTICDDALIGSVVRTTAALQQIELGFCQNFTDAGLIALAQHCSLLRLIGLRGLQLSNALTDKSLKHLTTHSATTLHTLYILDLVQVRVDVLVRLLKKCTRLHTLVLNCDLS
eukprot:gene29704-33538_t